ncbi:MAG: aldehyde dehydrogenase [Bacteroidetes bacterium GWF2_38_335]|nr:MAG: aldehyde dehydrogenase [Bacteroidetes bacterium GWF2_38_335]OFY77489.1 MAG: aldehyde dehydrogenase [Bacteroidetes bacterium RIFOXYA12_FULL_38_20]HBS87219.1 aldehyde dehydrogenase [Bacteroidales bacterium]
MENHKIYVAGRFIETPEILDVHNPFNNEICGKTFLAGKKELEIAIEKAVELKPVMAKLSSWKKSAILFDISQKIKENRQKMGEILSCEAAKPLKLALGEIDRAIQAFTVASEEAKRLPKEYISIDWTPAGEGKEGLIKYFPVGVVAGIAPFNFPLNLAVHKIAPAIAAGNPIILKPARSTPLSVLELARIIDQTDLPKGAFSVLPMNREAGNQLVVDERISMLSFTGSSSVGWKMKADAGKKKIALELGGNAGVIVSDTANIELAAAKCIMGGYAYSGQVCIHIQRIYVHEKIFDAFSEKFIEGVKKLKFGAPDNPETDVTAMIDEENALRVESWINEAVSAGAKVLCGGKRNGTYVEPTLITNTKREMKVCSLEIFGPVVTLEKYSDFKNAVDMVNDSEYGLQAGVFTNKIDEMNYAFNHIEAGGIMINEVPTFRVDHMPYGGVKNSGIGREGIKYAIHEMMEPKLMVRNVD